MREIVKQIPSSIMIVLLLIFISLNLMLMQLGWTMYQTRLC